MQQSKADEVERKLELLTRLVAIGLVNGKGQQEQIRLLSIAGMKPADIADLLGTTGNTVNVALSVLRKSSRMNLKSKGAKDDA
jgi:DNA-directed RNA polymerase specialized sigma24 family protein